MIHHSALSRRGPTACALALTLVLSPAAAHASGQAELAGAVAGRFSYTRDQIFVPVQHGDETLWALVDTGASASAIDAGVTERLELTKVGVGRVEGTAGAFETSQVRVTGLRWWGASLPQLTIPSYSLANLTGPEGAPVAMILGADALGGFALDIDFVHRWMVLQTDASYHAPALPLQFDNAIPSVEVKLEDQLVRLRMDTGASLFDTPDVYINVAPSTLTALQSAGRERAPVQHLRGVGAGGQAVDLPVYELSRLRIGDATITGARMIVQPPTGYFARPDALGFLGNNLLEQFGRVVIDYPARRLFLLGEAATSAAEPRTPASGRAP